MLMRNGLIRVLSQETQDFESGKRRDGKEQEVEAYRGKEKGMNRVFWEQSWDRIRTLDQNRALTGGESGKCCDRGLAR